MSAEGEATLPGVGVASGEIASPDNDVILSNIVDAWPNGVIMSPENDRSPESDVTLPEDDVALPESDVASLENCDAPPKGDTATSSAESILTLSEESVVALPEGGINALSAGVIVSTEEIIGASFAECTVETVEIPGGV